MFTVHIHEHALDVSTSFKSYIVVVSLKTK